MGPIVYKFCLRETTIYALLKYHSRGASRLSVPKKTLTRMPMMIDSDANCLRTHKYVSWSLKMSSSHRDRIAED